MSKPFQLAPVFAAIAMAAGCTPARVEYTPVPFTELPPSASPTPIVCTVNPERLTLEIQILEPGHVAVLGEGFAPDENLFVSLKGSTQLSNGTLTGQSLEGPAIAEADGALAARYRFEPVEGPATWEVAVLHSRGVACASASSD